ncbi:MAG TPA: FAD-binding oxidoreductase [Woeseiaceae bacterium]|nr:FAD-binding oxidoreductase [Woeseiaceae bacterium]
MDRRRFLRSSLSAAVLAALPNLDALAVSLVHKPTQVPGDIDAVTGDGREVTLARAAVQELSDALRGKLLLRGSEGYDDARFLLMPAYDRYPALVVQPTSAADVQHAVDFARDNSLLLAVKCGGHAAAGTSSCDKGLQIDLSRLRNVRVDVANRTARVAGGCLLGDLDYEAMAHGLVTTAGTVSHTGVGGLTLGGGFGRLGRRFGMSIDNVLEMDVVTPDGRLRRVGPQDDADLYWALRGGGGNFGVVTSFLFQLHPMQRDVVTGYFAYPLSEAKQVLRFYGEHCTRMPDEMSLGAGMGNRPGQDPSLGISFVWSGDGGEVEKYIAPLRKAGKVLSENVQTMDYVAAQRSGDVDDTRVFTGQMRSGFVDEVSDDLIDALVDNYEAHPERGARIVFSQEGGAISRVDRTATAFSQREAQQIVMSFVGWAPGADGTKHVDYINAHWDKAEPFTTGFYVNDYFDETQEQVNMTYRENFPRLLRVKQQYDPTNLFRLNANIRKA